jgi:hypothetical protein
LPPRESFASTIQALSVRLVWFRVGLPLWWNDDRGNCDGVQRGVATYCGGQINRFGQHVWTRTRYQIGLRVGGLEFVLQRAMLTPGGGIEGKTDG